MFLECKYNTFINWPVKSLANLTFWNCFVKCCHLLCFDCSLVSFPSRNGARGAVWPCPSHWKLGYTGIVEPCSQPNAIYLSDIKTQFYSSNIKCNFMVGGGGQKNAIKLTPKGKIWWKSTKILQVCILGWQHNKNTHAIMMMVHESIKMNSNSWAF